MLANYHFKDLQLCTMALTHPSARTEENYQRLEFLGDKVLGLAIAEIIYQLFPQLPEGELSVILANLVQTKILAKISLTHGLGEKLVMDIGEAKSGGAQNPKNLENALEAMIAAIYLDSDYITIRTIIEELWAPYLQDIETIAKKDDKSALQELVQKKYNLLPQYTLINKEGLDHAPTFMVEVRIEKAEPIYYRGTGKSRKAAEYDAAKQMLEILSKEQNHD